MYIMYSKVYLFLRQRFIPRKPARWLGFVFGTEPKALQPLQEQDVATVVPTGHLCITPQALYSLYSLYILPLL